MKGFEACIISRGMLTLGTAFGVEERERKRGGMAGEVKLDISGGILMLGTAFGVEEREGKRGGMTGIEACIMSGGMLMLVMASGVEERREERGNDGHRSLHHQWRHAHASDGFWGGRKREWRASKLASPVEACSC
ncbi:hypothetical protein QQF64_005304 [Cirrhinus molitorella]|uniref:Uncharacterized protein n=1 Tax=Cirrhinus molitorella TaxID=172907 RepID=A0ABR3MBT8_9TELE